MHVYKSCVFLQLLVEVVITLVGSSHVCVILLVMSALCIVMLLYGHVVFFGHVSIMYSYVAVWACGAIVQPNAASLHSITIHSGHAFCGA